MSNEFTRCWARLIMLGICNGYRTSEVPTRTNSMWRVKTRVSLVLTTANTILSRCHFTRHFSTFLPIESEMVFEWINVNVTRNLQAAHMNVPGYGILHLYNTHLCSA
jgi:hypothetical protein